MNKKTKLYASAVFAFLAILLIVGIKTIDVEPIGAAETMIGFAKINMYVHNLFGENILLFRITEFLGILAIAIAGVFALTGFVQLIKRKKISKVDREIITLGFLYLITIILYVVFEFKIVNYRPIIMPGCTEPESSFPSSHTMVSIVVFASAVMLIDKYIKRPKLAKTIKIVLSFLVVFTAFARLISGVHWFTDIVGGILISTALLFSFSAMKNR